MGDQRDYVDIIESAAPVAPTGIARIRRKGGAIQQSVDGGAFVGLRDAASASAAGLQSAGDYVFMPKLATALLTGADQTIDPFTDKVSRYIVPAGSQVANATLTITNAGAPGDRHLIHIIVLDTSAFTYTIRNSTPTTAFTKAASDPAAVYVLFGNTGVWQINTKYWAQT